ncbi:MAG: hypothetical protein D6820_08135 [Lentisphaerae bacterium]|nr:MAG: hypothetical protein D6820_08135 [Lentisphaerota bacterium]
MDLSPRIWRIINRRIELVPRQVYPDGHTFITYTRRACLQEDETHGKLLHEILLRILDDDIPKLNKPVRRSPYRTSR